MSVRWSFYTYLFFSFFHLFSILFSVPFLFPSSSFSSVLFLRRCSSFFRTPSILYLWILSFFYHLLQFDLIYHPLIFFLFLHHSISVSLSHHFFLSLLSLSRVFVLYRLHIYLFYQPYDHFSYNTGPLVFFNCSFIF